MISPLGLGKCGLQAPGWVAACHPSAHLASIFLCPTQESRNLGRKYADGTANEQKGCARPNSEQQYEGFKNKQIRQLEIMVTCLLSSGESITEDIQQQIYHGHILRNEVAQKKYCLAVALSLSDSLPSQSVLYVTGTHCHLRNFLLFRETASQQSNCPALCQCKAKHPNLITREPTTH